jgi:hypothetical protein
MSNLSKGIVLDSFEQLKEGLRTWSSFVGPEVYDVGGMMALFCACIENLRLNVSSDEIRELAETLSDDERAFLSRLGA